MCDSHSHDPFISARSDLWLAAWILCPGETIGGERGRGDGGQGCPEIELWWFRMWWTLQRTGSEFIFSLCSFFSSSISSFSSRGFMGLKDIWAHWIITQTRAIQYSGSLFWCLCHSWCWSSPECHQGPGRRGGRASGRESRWDFCRG